MDFYVEKIFKGPGFAETLYLGTANRQRIIRKTSNHNAQQFSRIALIREIRLLQSLPDILRPFFTELIRTNLENQDECSPDLPEIIYYDMPYYSPEDGWDTLSRLLLDNSLNREKAMHILGEIIDAAFLYFEAVTREPDKDYVENTMLQSIRESIDWARSDAEFSQLCAIKNLSISGRQVKNANELDEYFQNTKHMKTLLTPFRDRFIHGDFFPENIIYNKNTGKWLLLDPVSVRGVFRGDFILDVNKMDDWLSGELPALRLRQFSVDIHNNNVFLTVHNQAGKLGNLHKLGLSEWYREFLKDEKYTRIFNEESGWELRWKFVKAFYAFCMIPLADRQQAVARYFLAIASMNDFLESL
ncbi:MAG: hypothetical protein JXB48_10015 [Candidatus Latescibacteria bacterium]|nr:hypothetical protein [Candidatus Latescibacterota bacterium]